MLISINKDESQPKGWLLLLFEVENLGNLRNLRIFAARYIVDYEEVGDFAVIGDADRIKGRDWGPGVGTWG